MTTTTASSGVETGGGKSRQWIYKTTGTSDTDTHENGDGRSSIDAGWVTEATDIRKNCRRWTRFRSASALRSFTT